MADYNINAITRRVVFTGSAGLGPYAFSFEILDQDDLAVYFNATSLTITTDYTVTINANGTGSVNIVTGGSVPSTPTASDQIVIVGARDIERVTDFVTAGDLLASSLNEQLDALTIFDQQVAEENKRGLRAPVYDPALVEDGGVVDMTLPAKADRAGRFLAFDGNGNPTATTNVGDFKGDWAASTVYRIGDLVRDTTDDSIYRVNTDHTSSGSLPLNTNTNAAYYDLFVDLSDINASEAAAAASASAAASSASAASTSETNAAASASTASTQATNAASSATSSASSATAAQTAQAAAEAALDTFDDRFLGAKASDPSVDNDGNALQDGAIYYDTTNEIMKVYDLTNTIWRNLALTGTDQTNVNLVAGQISPTNNIATVAGISADITTTATNNANITTVATDIANVNLVGADIANVNTVATNLTDINAFADTYFISATAPSSPTLGDLWFDTTNDVMKVYGSGGFVNAGSSVNGTSNRYNYVVGTASGTYTGSTTVFPATYDAGYVDVYLNGAKLTVTSDFTATNGTDVTLATAATTSDVVDIVAYGTFTAATALSLGDNEKIQLGASQDLQIYHDGGSSWVSDVGAGNLKLSSDGAGVFLQKGATEFMGEFLTDGAVRLYYDNAAKFATTATGVDVTGTVTADVTRTSGANTNAFVLSDNVTGAQTSGFGTRIVGLSNNGSAESAIGFEAFGGTNNDTGLGFYTQAAAGGLTRQMTINSIGNVGIGSQTPSFRLAVEDGTAATRVNVRNTANAAAGSGIYFQVLNGASTVGQGTIATQSNGDMAIFTGTSSGAERMRILASGGLTFNGDTAAANALDDYEEGTWTVNVYKNGSALAVQNRSGYYIKIGNLVYVAFYWYNNSGLTTSGSTEYTIQGIPFTLKYGSGEGLQFIPAGYVYIQSNRANTDPMYRWQVNSANALHLYGVNATTNVSGGVLEFSGTGVLRVA